MSDTFKKNLAELEDEEKIMGVSKTTNVEVSAGQLELNESAILFIKETISQIPFTTVNDVSSTLFDEISGYKDEDSIKQSINFLKNTQLSEVRYSETDNDDFFVITNANGESIQVSNRGSGNGELRGALLRNLLDEEGKLHPHRKVYESLSEILKSSRSDIYQTAKNVFTKTGLVGITTSSEHFDFFASAILSMIKGKIEDRKISPNLDVKDISKIEFRHLNQAICKDIEVHRIFTITFEFIKNLGKIKNKADDLYKSGYIKASNEANKLYQDLFSQQNNLIKERVSLKLFTDSCRKLIDNAQQGELKNHRGFFGNIWNTILTLLNKIGMASVKKTDSIQITTRMKDDLRNMCEPNNKFECHLEKLLDKSLSLYVIHEFPDEEESEDKDETDPTSRPMR